MKYVIPFVIGTFLAACNRSAATDTFNDPAALPDAPVLQRRTWRVITSTANRREGTMATLFGNPAAVASARSGAAYSEGAHLWLVTWKRVEDPRWFGAFVPGALQSIEEVEFSAGAREPVYGKYEGASATKVAAGPEEAAKRAAAIVNQPALRLP